MSLRKKTKNKGQRAERKAKCIAAGEKELHKSSENVMWWLRGPGMKNNLAIYVNANVDVVRQGYYVNNENIAIRSAFWCDLETEEH